MLASNADKTISQRDGKIFGFQRRGIILVAKRAECLVNVIEERALIGGETFGDKLAVSDINFIAQPFDRFAEGGELSL